MTNYEFKKFITTQEDVTNELKKVIDLKTMREINAEEFTNIIVQYYKLYKEFIFEDVDQATMKLKGTPQIRLGKKRIKIIGTCFEDKGIAKLIDPINGVLKILENI